ncbi:hypothetical protein PGK06_012550 [Acinetobacter baumannii]|nr:hypothetical protein [Acinetobacter baumannii]
MTVSVTERLSPLYEGNGTNTRFDFTFRVFNQEDATGVSVKHQVGADFENVDESLYTVTLNEDNLGGYITFLNAPVIGFQFYIAGETPVDQALDITNYDNFYPDAIEHSLDKLTSILQEWAHSLGLEKLSRDKALEILDQAIQNQIREQGLALDQIDSYSKDLANRITNIVIERGWLAELIADKNGKNQQQLNDEQLQLNAEQQQLNAVTIQRVKSISEMLNIMNPSNGQTVFVQSYYEDTNEGGGNFTFNSNFFFLNDRGICLNGWVRNDTSVITPEMFGAKANDFTFDNSIFIQAMLETGMEFTVKAEKTYFITKILNTNGQKYNGVFSLKSVRSPFENNLQNTLDVSCEYKPQLEKNLKGLYVASAYDFVELLKIKSLGINTVLHYCQFENIPEDSSGSYLKLVKNALSAGLDVILNVEAIGLDTTKLSEVIAQIDTFTNVVGYSVIDEPASRRISLAEQNLRVSNLRTLTNKKLVTVDYATDTAAWLDIFSNDYDLFLVNSYSRYWAEGTTQSKIDRDLELMRINYGSCMKMTGSAKVIPCVQTFTDVANNPVEGPGRYSFDIDQILGASKVFSKVGNGDVAYFIWDAGFDFKVRNSTEFQKFIIHNCTNKDDRVYKTEPLLFGGVKTDNLVLGYRYIQRPLTELIQNIAYKDTTNTVDEFPSSGCYPIRLRKGSSETPITTLDNVDISGLGFRQSFSRLVTTKQSLKNVSVWGVLESTVGVTGNIAFEVYSTPDGGYTQIQRYTGGVTPGVPFKFSSKMVSNFDGTGETLVVGISYNNNEDIIDNYRRIFYGLIVSTNW